MAPLSPVWSGACSERLMKSFVRALTCLGLLTFWATSGFAACNLTAVAEMPLTELGGHFVVMVQIGDVTRPIIVDTGAATTMLKSSVADELKLTQDSSLSNVRPVLGIGQTSAHVYANVIPSVLAFGDLVFHDRSTAVADMDDGVTPEKDSVGLLGDDILSQFDVDFDFPSKKLTLYRAFGCYGTFTPWIDGYSSLPFVHDNTKVVIDVILNEERTRVIVDTGASLSVVSRKALALWGISEDRFSKPVGQIGTSLNGGAAFAVKAFLFDKVKIGDEIFSGRPMTIADIDFPPGSALLGLDFWKTHRIWISYPNNRMFLSSNASAMKLSYPVEKDAATIAANKKIASGNPASTKIGSAEASPPDQQNSPDDSPASTLVANLQTESFLHRSIVKDKAAWLLPVYSLDEHCESSAPTVTFSKPPDHGAASMEVRDRHTEYPVGSPLEKCNAREIPMIVVKYTPASGFVGEDTIIVDEVYPDGRHKVRHVVVTVD
jgi:predicted aspartyl protease